MSKWWWGIGTVIVGIILYKKYKQVKQDDALAAACRDYYDVNKELLKEWR